MKTFAFKIDPLTGEEYYDVYVRGRQLLNDPHLNKASGFSLEERLRLGLEGLVRPAICSMEIQAERAYEAFLRKPDDLEKYIYLIALQDRIVFLLYIMVA